MNDTIPPFLGKKQLMAYIMFCSYMSHPIFHSSSILFLSQNIIYCIFVTGIRPRWRLATCVTLGEYDLLVILPCRHSLSTYQCIQADNCCGHGGTSHFHLCLKARAFCPPSKTFHRATTTQQRGADCHADPGPYRERTRISTSP